MTGSDGTETTDTDAVVPGGALVVLRTALVGLVVLVVVAAGVLVWLLAQRRGEAADTQRTREDVMSQAEQFMLRVNTYGPDLVEGTTMPDYRKQVAEVITPKFDTDFEKNVPAAEATVVQGGLARSATVLSTGVSTLDDDSATALVAGNFINTYPKEPGSTERVATAPAPFRVQVSLVRTDGSWLVDDFTPLTGLDASQNPASQNPVDPSDLPTDGAVTDPTSIPSTDPSSVPSGSPSGTTP